MIKAVSRSDYLDVLQALEEEGYHEVKFDWMDYGQSFRVILEKEGKMTELWLRRHYYDTNEHGDMTACHGVIDIRDSLWWRKKMGGGNGK